MKCLGTIWRLEVGCSKFELALARSWVCCLGLWDSGTLGLWGDGMGGNKRACINARHFWLWLGLQRTVFILYNYYNLLQF